MKIKCSNPEAVVKRMFWLAWQACSGPVGMGFLQNNPSATEDEVWGNVKSAGDYIIKSRHSEPNEAYGDYVFGRMMKLGVEWDTDGITIPDTTPRVDYQAWSRKYATYDGLAAAAIESLK